MSAGSLELPWKLLLHNRWLQKLELADHGTMQAYHIKKSVHFAPAAKLILISLLCN